MKRKGENAEGKINCIFKKWPSSVQALPRIYNTLLVCSRWHNCRALRHRVWVYVCVCVRTGVHPCVGRAHGDISMCVPSCGKPRCQQLILCILHPSTHTLFFWNRISTWIWSSLIWLDLLAWGSEILLSPPYPTTVVGLKAAFMWVLCPPHLNHVALTL